MCAPSGSNEEMRDVAAAERAQAEAEKEAARAESCSERAARSLSQPPGIRGGAPAPLFVWEASMDDFIAANRLNWDDRAKLHATDTTGIYRIAEVLGRRRQPACDRSGRDRRRRRQAARPSAMPYRARHDQPRRDAARSRPGSISPHEAIAAARDFAAARRPRRALRAIRTSTTRPPRSARHTTSPTSPGARSAGCPTFFAGRRSWPTCSSPAASSISPRAIPRRCAWRRSTAGSCRTTPGGRRSTRRSSWTSRRPTPATRGRSRTRRTYEWIHPLSDIVTALIAGRACTLEWLHEHELLPYRLFPMMEPAESPGLFRLPDSQPRLALSFSLKATKRG